MQYPIDSITQTTANMQLEDEGEEDIVIRGELLKWTNYIHGWQVRHFTLTATGTISYYLSEDEKDHCRGSAQIQKMIIQTHKHSEVRFDLVTPSVTWHMRSHTPPERSRWLAAIERQQLECPGSDASISSSMVGLTESGLETLADLNVKLEELNSFKESLSHQLTDIRSQLKKGKIGNDNAHISQQLSTLQATAGGIVAAASQCVEMMTQRETYWQEQLNKEREKRSQIDILYRAANRENSQLILSNPQEGPHLNEDEFFDALETTLEKMDLQGQTAEQEVAQAEGASHKMHAIMQDTIAKYKIISKEDPETSESWSPVAKEGGTRIYRKEEERENVMVDYLVAITQINGVTAAELAEVFHSKELKSKWDHSIEGDKLLEQLDDHCAIYHQILKRVWPTAQRDMVYASHKQKLSETDPEYPDWIVCNISCEHKDAPDGESGFCRATIEVVMYCQTVVLKKRDGPLGRDDVACKIVYSATVNPGGWAPAAAVRAISKKEYPKFIKKISSFTQEYKKGQAISF